MMFRIQAGSQDSILSHRLLANTGLEIRPDIRGGGLDQSFNARR